MTTLTEEQQKAKAEKAAKAAADKASYEALAKWHEGECKRYLAKADACIEIELVSAGSPGKFGGI